MHPTQGGACGGERSEKDIDMGNTSGSETNARISEKHC